MYGFFNLESIWTKDFDFSIIDLADIIEHPWFKRGWTFQEIVLASDVTVICGSSTLRWDVLIRGLSKVFQDNLLFKALQEFNGSLDDNRPMYINDTWFFEFSNDEAEQTLACVCVFVFNVRRSGST